MIRPSRKNIFCTLLILVSAGLSLYINSYWKELDNLEVLLRHSSLNTWFFYNFNEAFFLDFNFHNIHPYYLPVTIMAKILSLKIVLALFFLFLGFLFLVFFQIGKFTFNDFILWSVSLPFLYAAHATLFLLWIQYLLFRIFQNKTSIWDESRLLIGRVIFYSAISWIFLPGLVLIYCLDFFEQVYRFREWNILKNMSIVLAFVIPVVTICHIFLAIFLFDVPLYHLVQYLELPIHAYLTKARVNNHVVIDVFLGHVETYKNLYMVIPYLYFLSVINDERVALLIKTTVLCLLLVIGIYFTQGAPLFFVLCIYFVLLAVSRPILAALPKKIMILMGALVLILFHILGLSLKNHQSVEVQDSDIIISFADFNRIHLYHKEEINVIILDMKIIPVNVEQLLTDIRSGKMEPFLNEYIMTFLDRELIYGASILERLEKKKYAIYLKSAIHPETEKPPYRRVYEVWNLLKDTGSKIVLF